VDGGGRAVEVHVANKRMALVAMSQHRDMGRRALFLAVHSSVLPPLTEIFSPVMNDAASEARNATAWATETRLLLHNSLTGSNPRSACNVRRF
jgi:hypothetical protein